MSSLHDVFAQSYKILSFLIISITLLHQGPVGYQVSFFFDTLKVQYKEQCTSDYVQIVGIEVFYGVK